MTTCLTDLPEDVLANIARHVGPSLADLLPFAEASPLLHAPALAGQDNHLRLTSRADPRRWTSIALPHLRSLSLLTPVPTDPPLFAAYGLLSAPHLHTLATRADNFTLSLLPKAPLLRHLDLHLRRADLFPQLLHAVATLAHLTSLHISFAPDFTLLRLPPARRCACAPLREPASAASLARAAPRVTDFSLACGCAAAADCTIPPFRSLGALAFSGALPDAPPQPLEAFAPTLEKLSLRAPAVPVALAQALGDSVTHLIASAPAMSAARLSAPQINAIAAACPRLQVLRTGLHPDAAGALAALPNTLRELHVWQPLSRATARSPLTGPPIPRGVLAKLSGIRELQLHGPAVPAVELAALMCSSDGKVSPETTRATSTTTATANSTTSTSTGGSNVRDSSEGSVASTPALQTLVVNPAGQPAPLDMWIRTVLAAVRRAPQLGRLSFPKMEPETVAHAGRTMAASHPSERCRDLQASVERAGRRRPRVEMQGVDDVLRQLLRSCEREAKKIEANKSAAAKAAAAETPASPPAREPPAADIVMHNAEAQLQPAVGAPNVGGMYEQLGVHIDVGDDGEDWSN